MWHDIENQKESEWKFTTHIYEIWYFNDFLWPEKPERSDQKKDEYKKISHS